MRILINLKDEFTKILDKIGRKHKLLQKYGGVERVSYAAVANYLITTHPEVKEEKS